MSTAVGTVGAVVLTRGGRPEVLALALASLLRQRDVDLDVVVVGNGWSPTGLPEGVRGVGLPQDVGIPAGRNAGIDAVRGDLLLFLDDDAQLAQDDALARLAARFAADPRLGAVQLRVEPLGGGARSRDWVGRLGGGDPARSGDVTVLWEGAVAIPRRVLDEAGRWPGEFRFVHEGVDLAWRLLDRGYRVHYAGDLVCLHPPPPASPIRHAYSAYFGARNRVWLARRHLPVPLGVLYVLSFLVRTLPRLAGGGQLRVALRGYRDGLRGPGPGRRPLRARTLWAMVRAGRPPVV